MRGVFAILASGRHQDAPSPDNFPQAASRSRGPQSRAKLSRRLAAGTPTAFLGRLRVLPCLLGGITARTGKVDH